MESSLLLDDPDVLSLRELRARLGPASTIVDFDEQILLPSVRAATRIWRQDQKIVGFAFVDEYSNLWFETEPEFASLDELETEIVDWGVTCVKKQNIDPGTEHMLDCTCQASDDHRVSVLKKHGFKLERARSLQYSRALHDRIPDYPLPAGFSIRSVRGESEVEQLVALHRAAFGTENMTIEYRLAMMNAPLYRGELDLVAVTAADQLSAFCVCGFDNPEKTMGYTDPIGTHPSYQGIGLGKALVSAGLIALKNAGVGTVRLGTSSENIAMQHLAAKLGFVCVSEKLWFSKTVSRPAVVPHPIHSD